LYALGGTHLKAKRPAEAERCFVRAADACLDAGNDTLLAMVLIHLGVALYRQGRTEEALQSLEAGPQTFRSPRHPTREVHGLDTKATLLAEAGRRDAAEQTWQEALRLAEDIRVPDLPELRESCIQELMGKVRPRQQPEVAESPA